MTNTMAYRYRLSGASAKPPGVYPARRERFPTIWEVLSGQGARSRKAGSGGYAGAERKETVDEVSKTKINNSYNCVLLLTKEKYREYLNRHLYSHSSYRRQELFPGIAAEHGKQPFYANRNDSSKDLVRSKVEMNKVVADEAVVVLTPMET